MKQLLSILQIAVSVCAAVQIYSAAVSVSNGDEGCLLQIVTAVCALCAAVLAFLLSNLRDRVKNLEDVVGIYVDNGFEQLPQMRECPACHREVDISFEICTHCGARILEDGYFPSFDKAEVFDTDNPDYNGTEYSYDDVVSANFDSEE